MYGSIPMPEKIKKILTSVGSQPKCSAIPPQTPAINRSLEERFIGLLILCLGAWHHDP